MDDIDDARIKTEIDKIMKDVKNIMQKVNAIMPKDETEPQENEDAGENPNAPDMNGTQNT